MHIQNNHHVVFFLGRYPAIFIPSRLRLIKSGVGLSAISFYCPLEGTTGVFPPLNKKDAAAIPNADTTNIRKKALM